jgi:hypothetical protein
LASNSGGGDRSSSNVGAIVGGVVGGVVGILLLAFVGLFCWRGKVRSFRLLWPATIADGRFHLNCVVLYHVLISMFIRKKAISMAIGTLTGIFNDQQPYLSLTTLT